MGDLFKGALTGGIADQIGEQAGKAVTGVIEKVMGGNNDEEKKEEDGESKNVLGDLAKGLTGSSDGDGGGVGGVLKNFF